MTVSPSVYGLLRDPGFRRIWAIGATLFMLRWLDALVLGVFVYELTGSAVKVALIFFFRLAPQLLLGLIIGTLADRISRKTLLVLSLTGMAAVAASVMLLILSGRIEYWHLGVAVFINGIFAASEMPVRRVMIGDIVEPANLARAIGLDSATANLMRVFGPVLGGILLQSTGAAGAYALAAGLLSLAVVAALTLSYRARHDSARSKNPLLELINSLRYIRSQPLLTIVLIVTVVMNLFGFPYIALIPAIGTEILGADAFGIGALSALEGSGAVLGSLWIASRTRTSQHLRIFLSGSAFFLLCVLLFSHSQSYLLSAVLLFCGGFGLAGFTTMQSTIMLSRCEPAMRGRVLGALALCIGAQPLGSLQIAMLARLFSVPTTITISALCGLVTLAIACLLWRLVQTQNILKR